MKTNPAFLFAEKTHVGQRPRNEDCMAHCMTSTNSIFVVTDGLGGHPLGDIASQLFANLLIEQATRPHLTNLLLKSAKIAMETLIEETYALFKCAILKQYQGQDARTTLAAAWIYPEGWISAHIGDSRIYHLTPTTLHWRSLDHSLVQEMLNRGEITIEQMDNHPLQHIILRSIDIYERPKAEIISHPPLLPGEGLILCTDGFWEHVSLDGMKQLIQQKSHLQRKLDQLILKGAEQGKPHCDNLTAQCIIRV